MLFGNHDPATGQYFQAGPIQYRDDIHVGSPHVSVPSGDWYVGDFVVHDSCSGDLDGGGRLEPIYLGLAEAEGSHTAIRMAGWNLVGGAHDLTQLATEKDNWNGWWTGVQGVHGVAGDVDGDGTDELLITESRGSQMQLRVLRLGHDGGIPEFTELHSQVFTGWFGRVAVAQLDGDDALEIVVAHGTPGAPFTFGSLYVDAFDDLGTGVAFLDTVHHLTTSEVCVELVPGEFDGDPQDEIAFGVQTWVSKESIIGSFDTYDHYVTWTLSYDFADGQASYLRTTSHDTFDGADWAWDALGGKSRERFVAADYPGDGKDRVVWLHVQLDDWSVPLGGGADPVPNWDILLRAWDAVSGQVDAHYLFDARAESGPFGTYEPGYRGGDLAVVDDDGSGDENLLVTLGVDKSLGGTQAWQTLVFHPGSSFQVGYLPGAGILGVPFMTGGDYDG